MQIKIPWGKNNELFINLPEGTHVKILENEFKREKIEDFHAEVLEAIKDPIGSPPLEQILKKTISKEEKMSL
ncbi:MAG: hypothetical protein ACTSU2_09025 [Promethearchaeota archaeon]